jgi:hypothetical protein
MSPHLKEHLKELKKSFSIKQFFHKKWFFRFRK